MLAGILFSIGLASALDDSQADLYAPVHAKCPDDLRVRPASEGLSRSESSWKASRGEKAIPALSSYLTLANIDGFNVQEYIQRLNSTSYPVVGLAISGGGTQSGVGGLGIWQAFDARNPAAVQARTGGLTQVLSYLTGLSGGGALTVSTLASNDFVTVTDLRKQINFATDYTKGKDGNQDQYLQTIFDDVASKAEQGLPVSVADVFGFFWATYLPEKKTYNNFSDLAAQGTVFSRGEGPMPIISLSEVIPGQSPNINNIMWPGRTDTNGFNLTSYEVTPFEFGSWRGGRVQAFMPTTYLGTSMSNGTSQNNSECVRGFDKFTFIQGSTADAFNAWFIDEWYNIPVFAKRKLEDRQTPSANITVPPEFEKDGRVQLVSGVADEFRQTFNESLWARYPNPFQNFNPAMKNVDELLLIDGSLSGETNPIRPLIIPERQVDLVIVYEASSDAANNWVNGTNLINSAQSAAQGNIPFPRIPDVATLVTQNMTKQPTFFGCKDAAPTPLVLYLPNSPWSGYINFTYTKSSFTDNEFDLTADNAFQLATYGNGTVDAAWPACLACATIRGSLLRLGLQLPQQCQQCFEKHCWNGVTATRAVTPDDFNPSLRLNSSFSYREWDETYWKSATNRGGGSGGATPPGDPNPNGASRTLEMGMVGFTFAVASITALISLL
ncbi:lysophosphoplipase A [Colletotrichum truncatum]|uniref:Lysophosphoplipase A n=1 Tax=Colletotrichum truncatum TaxID=5467 RepID=A0ACC3ZK26_COLTU|nr:lysophosphoplipase A [Colletotrichum truncatum]KAF6799845.1 lysophosphoplipase A [Colletotrichum truncatum]